MKKIISMMVFIAIALAVRADSITLVDETDLSPIAGATVISDNGLIIGQTDKKGEINVSRKDFPLSVRCFGYETLTVKAGTDMAKMVPAKYALGELVVTPIDRPIKRVLTYAREYTTGATKKDTVQMYSECMLEYFITEGKVKGYRKSDRKRSSRNIRRYARIVKNGMKDSLARPASGEEIGVISFVETFPNVPNNKIKEPESMAKGAKADTIYGDYYPRFIYSKGNGIFKRLYDMLSDNKEHIWSPALFKMVGITSDFYKVEHIQAFKENDKGVYDVNDFLYDVHNIHLMVRGRLIKKSLGVKDNIEIDSYIEQYPVLIESLSVEEYKELKESRNDTQIEFMIPELVQPLAPAVQRLVDRFEPEGRSVDEQRNIKGI